MPPSRLTKKDGLVIGSAMLASPLLCGCSYGNECLCYHSDASQNTVQPGQTYWLRLSADSTRGPAYIQEMTSYVHHSPTTCFSLHHFHSPFFFFLLSERCCQQRRHGERERSEIVATTTAKVPSGVESETLITGGKNKASCEFSNKYES